MLEKVPFPKCSSLYICTHSYSLSQKKSGKTILFFRLSSDLYFWGLNKTNPKIWLITINFLKETKRKNTLFSLYYLWLL